MELCMGFPPYTGKALPEFCKWNLSTVLFRTGDVVFNYENGSLVVGAQAATQRLKGHFNWQLDFKVFAPRGKISLQIDHLDIKIGLSQPVNVQKKPRLEVLQVTLGNIQVIKYISIWSVWLKLYKQSLYQRLVQLEQDQLTTLLNLLSTSYSTALEV